MTANALVADSVVLRDFFAITKPPCACLWPGCSVATDFPDPVLKPLSGCSTVCPLDPEREMKWTEYAVACCCSAAVTMLCCMFMPRVQLFLPLESTENRGSRQDWLYMGHGLFTPNTNWQNYSGESTDELLHPNGWVWRIKLRPAAVESRFGDCVHREKFAR